MNNDFLGILLQILNLILFSGLTAIIVIYIIWDHIKDDRLLTKKVQEFFEDIQDLIFYMFQYQYYNSFDVKMNFQFIKEGFFKSKEKGHEEKKNMRKINYYVAKIKENYQYTKYIGLVGIVENEKMRLVDKTNITIYLDTKMTEELVKQFCNNPTHIIAEDIIKINQYLTNLSEYWKIKHKKIILMIIKIRPVLKIKVDYSNLKGLTQPYILTSIK